MIRSLAVRQEDLPVLRAWCGSTSRPTYQGAPVGDLAAIPVDIADCLELAAATVRVVTDDGTFDVQLGPPPELAGLFRRGDGWWCRAEDAGNLRALLVRGAALTTLQAAR